MGRDGSALNAATHDYIPIDSIFGSPCTSQEIVEGTVLGRIGQDSDMAGVSLFLASKAGSYVTGAVVVVDGGILVKPRL